MNVDSTHMMLEVEIYPVELKLAQLDEDVTLLVVELLDAQLESLRIHGPYACQRGVEVEIQ